MKVIFLKICTLIQIILFSNQLIVAAPLTNKEIVTSFYTMAFNDHKPAEATKLFVGDTMF